MLPKLKFYFYCFFFRKKLNGIYKRIRCAQYGIFYFLNKDYRLRDSLLINGSKLNLKIQQANNHEFEQICLYDCYRLKELKKQLKQVNTIVDIGANHGLFIVAARKYFSGTSIISYEPNIHLKEILSYNAKQLGAEVHFEAVMKNNCTVNLLYTDSDLETKTEESVDGMYPGVSFRSIIERERTIDILKMDCEGGEWALLENKDSWKRIRAVTMEYHLIAGKYDNKKLLRLLDELNFNVIHQKVLTKNQGIIVALSNGRI